MDADPRIPEMGSIDEARHRVERLERELAQARMLLDNLLAGAATRSVAPAEAATSLTDASLPLSGSVQQPSTVTHTSLPAAKVALFRERFAGRTDCYAVRWENPRKGTKGWKPAVRGGFYTDRTTDADLLPLTDQVIWDHLSHAGPRDTPFHAGLYPLRRDEKCKLLVCDFDDDGWREAASAYAGACRDAGLDPLAEISRSGDGAHVWLFLESFMPATVVRGVGMGLLRRAMGSCSKLAMSSYDRFFPSQNTLPVQSKGRMRLGNLIALPMEGECRSGHTTVFADPTTWEELPDQFAALAAVRPASSADIARLAPRQGGSRSRLPVPAADTGVPDSDQDQRGEWGLALEVPRRRRARKEVRAQRVDHLPITITRGAMVHIPVAGLPTGVVADLEHMAALWNPEFFRRQRQRLSTFGVPRTVICFERDEKELRVPRGVQDAVVELLAGSGFEVTVKTRLRRRPRLDVSFTGTLRAEQKRAVTALTRHDTGILEAPTGSGKTVMACAIIARRHTPTAVLVHSKELAAQWRERLTQFLDLDLSDIGQVGGGRQRRTGRVDIVFMGSISRRTQDPSFLEEYGLIVVDECHKVGSPSLDAALRSVGARRWVGLTATPYRSDQLNGLITMQCGPIRYSMSPSEDSRARSRQAIIHTTGFTTDEDASGFASQQQIFTELVEDQERNSKIVNLVVEEANRGRTILVLTRRVEHVETLVAMITDALSAGTQTAPPVLALSGRLPPAQRAAVRQQLGELDSARQRFVLVAIDRIAGESIDLPTMDTEFLAMPIRFKGRVVQFIGRVTRDVAPGSDQQDRKAIVVHDFHDASVPWLHHMFLARRRSITAEGFVVREEP